MISLVGFFYDMRVGDGECFPHLAEARPVGANQGVKRRAATCGMPHGIKPPSDLANAGVTSRTPTASHYNHPIFSVRRKN